MLFLTLAFISCDIELPIFKDGNGNLYEQGTSVSNNTPSDDSQEDTSATEPEDTGEVEDTSTNQ